MQQEIKLVKDIIIIIQVTLKINPHLIKIILILIHIETLPLHLIIIKVTT
jgi:hypothetical protein